MFNKVIHIQAIGENLISLTTKPPTPDHIVDVVKSPLRSEWCDSIFQTVINGKIQNIQCTIFTFIISIKYKNTHTQNIF